MIPQDLGRLLYGVFDVAANVLQHCISLLQTCPGFDESLARSGPLRLMTAKHATGNLATQPEKFLRGLLSDVSAAVQLLASLRRAVAGPGLGGSLVWGGHLVERPMKSGSHCWPR